MKKILPVILLLLAIQTNAQIVSIPDSTFKAILLANSTINTNSDGEIQESEAVAFTGEVNVSYQDISDLSGIEEFINITRLLCDYNSLTSLDVSANTQLTYLSCDFTSLESLDISFNTQLKYLNCSNNPITKLLPEKRNHLVWSFGEHCSSWG